MYMLHQYIDVLKLFSTLTFITSTNIFLNDTKGRHAHIQVTRKILYDKLSIIIANKIKLKGSYNNYWGCYILTLLL